jgi:hypothetical protein
VSKYYRAYDEAVGREPETDGLGKLLFSSTRKIAFFRVGLGKFRSFRTPVTSFKSTVRGIIIRLESLTVMPPARGPRTPSDFDLHSFSLLSLSLNRTALTYASGGQSLSELHDQPAMP